jgi:hypothetical protein
VSPRLVAACSHLKTLDTSHNLLVAWPLPPAPGCLAHLSTLDVSFNRCLAPLQQSALAACSGSLRKLSLSGASLKPHAHLYTLHRLARPTLLWPVACSQKLSRGTWKWQCFAGVCMTSKHC